MQTRMLITLAAALACGAASATTYYVDASRPDDSGDGLSWATAKKTIQAAIDVASANDLVLVTDGVYNVGARVWAGVSGALSNRVVIDKALTVRSVNGPTGTIIAGAVWEGGQPVRGVALTNGAILDGFTVSNGMTRAGGDYTSERSGGGVWCFGDRAQVFNCVLIANRAVDSGGGLYRGSCTGSVFIANRAVNGGGVYNATVSNCVFEHNLASSSGGGQNAGSAAWCVYENNYSSNNGGAVASVVVTHSILRNNGARYDAGAVYGGTIYNSMIYGNRAGRLAGGAQSATLENCTVVDNHSSGSAGGVSGGTVRNSIVYFNHAFFAENYDGNPTFSSSVTTPHPGGSNMSNDPRVVALTNPRLLPDSPCINAGTYQAWMAGAVDIDGEPRVNGVVDIGADEVWPSALTGALQVSISALLTQAVVGAALEFGAVIGGKPTQYIWTFGDGAAATNVFTARHAYVAPGVYPVMLTAYNASGAAAATVSVTVVSSAAWYVKPSGNDAQPGTNWATAKQTIQAAVDIADTAGGTVWLDDGVYAVGDKQDAYSMQFSRFAAAKPIVIRSVNGPAATAIEGAYTSATYIVRCAYLDNDAVLAGVTLRYGWTFQSDLNQPRQTRGGGAWVEYSRGMLSNCVVVNNRAYGGGGGVYGGVLYGCIISNNVTENLVGGGASCAELFNCIVASNRSLYGDGGGVNRAVCYDTQVLYNRGYNGGGATLSRLYNCTISDNFASYDGGGLYNSDASNCVLRANRCTGDSGGGGAFGGTHHACLFVENYASSAGGAARNASLTNCQVYANRTAGYGGGGHNVNFVNCMVTGNVASSSGGGAVNGTHYNSIFIGNRAQENGGGVYYATVYNCTLVGNTALSGGGVYGGTLYNSIVYYNSAVTGANHYAASMEYSCATPRPAGAGNMDVAPGIVSIANPRLTSGAPCEDAGTNQPWMATSVDIDGEPRLNGYVDMGADEVWLNGLTGALSARIVAAYTNAIAGAAIPFEADITGKPETLVWTFGDGGVISNQGVISYVFGTAGTFAVILRAANATMSAGDTVTVQVVDSAAYYVALSGDDNAPGTNWAAPKATIQAAIEVAPPGAVIWVSNGTYTAGGASNYPVTCHLRSRVAVNKAVVVRSFEGPAHTIIAGQGPRGSSAIRGVYLGAGAVLSGFTISNGATLTSGNTISDQAGGGVWAEPDALLTNCHVVGNQAHAYGGGFYGGEAVDCVFDNNFVYGTGGGGGAARARVSHAVFTRNVAQTAPGGAALQCSLMNAIVHSNAAYGGGGISEGSAYNSFISANYSLTAGGGANQAELIRCVVSNNACGDGWNGGGMSGGRAFNSLLIYNHARGASGYGGGAANALFVNCTVVSNAAGTGGGASGCVVSNTIVYYNSAATSTNYGSSMSFYNSCTWPMPGTGFGTITNEPGLVGLAAGDARLVAGSPCIGAGLTASWMLPPDIRSTDLDGQARLAYGAPDIGAYEYVAGLWCDFYATPTNAFFTNAIQFASMVAGTNRADLFYRWDFESDGFDDLAGPAYDAPAWLYTDTGFKTITLVVSNVVPEAAVSTRTNYVFIIPEPARFALLVCGLMCAWRHQRGMSNA